MITKKIKIPCDSINADSVNEVATALKNGETAAIPTETVYGLAASALNEKAIMQIFEVKGRPQDNPLIVHIAELDELSNVAKDIPEDAVKLAKAFWPGPLTMVLSRNDSIPAAVSAGLDTVAVRMPSHPVARAIIKAAGVPIAAPSANISGRPSPTNATRCIEDLEFKIPYIVDSGDCQVGVESTVISLAFGQPILLRPGRVTVEQLEQTLGKTVILDDAVKGRFSGGTASAPGMKYKHYSPRAEVTLIIADSDAYSNYVNEHITDGTFALCFDEDATKLNCGYVSLGPVADDVAQAYHLFDSLRQLDDLNAAKVYAHCPAKSGVGLAVYNRLVRSAGFNIVNL